MANQRLIVGLGNPGSDYEYTRHNLGFLAIRKLSEKLKFKFGLSSFTNGLTAEGKLGDVSVTLLMPLTYMNKSGGAVKQTLAHTQAALEDTLIVCDDLSLPFEKLRLRPGGSDGGNNGLKSIIASLQEKNFPRLRMGIGRPSQSDQDVDYVLSEFSKQEKKELENFLDTAAECCVSWINNGIHPTMDQFNSKK